MSLQAYSIWEWLEYKRLIMKTNYEQVYFAEELEDITTRIIPSSFGNIHSITAGTPGQPLILVVHGSGPKNSSQEYAYFLHQYLVRVSYLQKFYIVAIDCPGYGQSQGSKEAVKTFPLQLFRQILNALGYKRYYGMMGHSQGGASIFNAVYEDPSMTEYLIMDRPVCGNIQRFQKFALPTLLIYDIEDDGHPIWQGKLLYKYLSKSELYTYRSSRNPYWVPDNIWETLLQFIGKQWGRLPKAIMGRKDRPKFHSTEKKLSESFGSVQKKAYYSVEKIKVEKEEMKKPKLVEIEQVKSEAMSSMGENPYYSSNSSELFEEKIEVAQEKPPRKESSDESQASEELMKVVDRPAKKQEEGPEARLKAKEEDFAENNKCAICYETLYRPMTTNCHHSFCHKCLLEALLINEKCPLCRAKITKKTPNSKLQAEVAEQMGESEQKRREGDFQKVETMMKSIVYIEIGNTSRLLQTKQSHFAKTKKKYNWEVFVKPPRGFTLEEVGFNINMGETNARPVWLKQAPYAYESRGTFSFACEVTIRPRNRDYAPMTAVYRINVEPGAHSKVIALRKKCYQK